MIEQNHASSIQKSSVVGCSNYAIPGTEESVVVTSVNSYGEFWVQLTRLSPQLDQLMNQVHEMYSQMNPSDLQIISPMIGQYCCSCFTGDDGWYRACIEEVDGKSLTVNYIDYGNSEHLDASKVKVLNRDFDGSPRYALLCCLENSSQFSSLTSASETLLDKEFTALFKSKEAPFKIDLVSNGTSVSETLMKQMTKVPAQESKAMENMANGDEFTRTVKSFDETAEVGKTYQMYFLEASSPNEFYCQPVASENELAKLMEDIASYTSTSKTQKYEGKAGDFVLAKYNEDGNWYRACIKENMRQNVSYARIC